jgi:hypothetical protein
MPALADPLQAAQPRTHQPSRLGVADSNSLLTPGFWQAFAPDLHIASPSHTLAPMPTLDAAASDTIRQLVRGEGYFQGTLTQWNTPFAPVTRLVTQLASKGLLPVFAFVYDEMWMLAHQLHPVISALLGPHYAMLPDFWAWHIDPSQAESGWQPHRDKGYKALAPDGSPTSVTAWIPLTAATPLNSCMYIVPADRDPTYGTPQDKEWKFAYPDVRALPAQPGDFFVWNQAVLHWGSHATPRAGAHPRMSCAFEFQRTDIPAWNTPLIPPRAALSFEDRLRLIGKQVKQYQHMYPLPAHLSDLADRLLAA